METSQERYAIIAEFFKYGVVGLLAFVLDFSILFIFTEFLGVNYLLAAALGFISGLLLNYVLSLVWVFKKKCYDSRWKEFSIFALIGVGGLVLNELIIWLFTEEFGLHYTVSKIISTIVVFLYNFGLRKFILFRG
ncbi:MAG: GtrA family protein [Desulfomicrobium sp.]